MDDITSLDYAASIDILSLFTCHDEEQTSKRITASATHEPFTFLSQPPHRTREKKALTEKLVEPLIHPVPIRRRHEIPRVLVNLRHLWRSQVDLLRLQESGLLDKLPPEEQDWEHGDHGVGEQEGRDVPVALEEDGVAADERHDEGSCESVVGGVRHERRRVR